MVEYKTIEGVPGRYFDCQTHRITLSVERCTAMFRAAISGEAKIERHKMCAECVIGGKHAGCAAKRPPVVGRLLCARCHESATRLLRGAICVSCYNREREVLAGKNAKGKPPSPVEMFWSTDCGGKTAAIHEVHVGEVSKLRMRNCRAMAANSLEVVLSILRADTEATFSRLPPRPLETPPLMHDRLAAKRVRRYHSDALLLMRGVISVSGYGAPIVSPSPHISSLFGPIFDAL